MDHRYVVLITGGKSGIGRAIAERAAEGGHRVFVTSRSAQPGVVARGIELVALDTGDEASIEACIKTVNDTAGRIDVLVNCVGSGMIGAVEEISLQEAHALFDDVFWSAARMIKAVLPGMRAQGSGRIITMSSLGGRMGFPFSAFYSAGKFALEGFCEGLYLEMKQFGISVSLIEPAGVNTPVAGNVPMAFRSLAPYGDYRHLVARDIERSMRKGLAPDTVARHVMGVLADSAPRLRYVVGAPAKLMTTLLRLAPESVGMFMRRKMHKLP